jgi:L-iditol 2-dehydrogenase
MNVLCSKMRGATQIIVSDVVDHKLNIARDLGATEIVNINRTDLTTKIAELTDGEGTDVVIDCSGTKSGLQITPSLVRSGGTIVMVGMPSEDIVGLDITKLIWKEVNLSGSFRYDNCYPIAINALSRGLIDVDALITHEFSLEELAKAFKFVIEHNTEVVKAIVRV